MANISDRRAKAEDSRWGVYGEEILWPTGFTCLGRKTGTAAHGETWVIQDDIPEAIQALEKKKAKIEAGLEYVDNEIEQLEQQLADDLQALSSTDDMGRFKAVNENSSFDPYAEQEIYGGESDEDEEGTWNKKAMNVHDHQDPEVLLEEKNRIRTGLEEARDIATNELERLEKSKFQMAWKDSPIPAQLVRLDAPWLQFAEKDFSRKTVAKTTIDKMPDTGLQQQSTAAASRLAVSGDSSKKTSRTKASNEEEPPKRKTQYCAKLIAAGVAEASDGRRFQQSDALGDKAAIRSLIADGEELLKEQWRLIVGAGGSFDAIGILPLVAALDVARKHKDYRELYNAAFVSPLCVNGSVPDAVSKIAGKKRDYWFEDDLIKRNLKATINSMATLQRSNIKHGNIKPSNVYISDDGYHLLVGDFLPQTELKRWFTDLAKSLSNTPIYFSPELCDQLVVKKEKNMNSLSKAVDLHKHDVFCLGLTYYYITTRIDPKGFHRSEKTITKALDALRSARHDPELVDLLVKMLAFNPKDRPTFWDMLTFGEQATVTGQGILGVVKGLFGIADTVTTEADAATSSTRTSTVSGRPKEEAAGSGCNVQ